MLAINPNGGDANYARKPSLCAIIIFKIIIFRQIFGGQKCLTSICGL